MRSGQLHPDHALTHARLLGAVAMVVTVESSQPPTPPPPPLRPTQVPVAIMEELTIGNSQDTRARLTRALVARTSFLASITKCAPME